MKRMAIISGIICSDLKEDKTNNGRARTRFSVAVNEGFGENRVTTFIPCTTYGKTAEFAAKYLHKGKPVEVTGRLNPYTYERDGQKRSGFEVLADEVDFVPGDTKKTDDKVEEE